MCKFVVIVIYVMRFNKEIKGVETNVYVLHISHNRVYRTNCRVRIRFKTYLTFQFTVSVSKI